MCLRNQSDFDQLSTRNMLSSECHWRRLFFVSLFVLATVRVTFATKVSCKGAHKVNRPIWMKPTNKTILTYIPLEPFVSYCSIHMRHQLCKIGPWHAPYPSWNLQGLSGARLCHLHCSVSIWGGPPLELFTFPLGFFSQTRLSLAILASRERVVSSFWPLSTWPCCPSPSYFSWLLAGCLAIASSCCCIFAAASQDTQQFKTGFHWYASQTSQCGCPAGPLSDFCRLPRLPRLLRF